MTTKQSQNNLNISSFDKIPPHSIEAEQSLLGSMLISSQAVGDVIIEISGEDFYHESHQLIFEAINELFNEGQPIDAITVSEKLRQAKNLEQVGGLAYLHRLINMVPTAANVSYYAGVVQRTAIMRRLIRAATDIATIAYQNSEDVEKAIDECEGILFAVSKKRGSENFTHIKPIVEENWNQVEERFEQKREISGTPTGFIDLDRKILGLHRSDLIIVAARPSMGKTSFVLDIARHIGVNESKPVAIFSLEMDRYQLGQRLLCAQARIDVQALGSGNLESSEWSRLGKAMGVLSEAPIFIDDTPGINIMEIRAKSRRLLSQEKELGLIVVDYLQLMTGRGRAESRQQEISEISRALKVLGRELEVPILAVSQLSRAVESRTDKHPMLSDLRESGAIEQDADLVIFIYRDKYYHPDTDDDFAEIIISKHRNGPTGKMNLTFLEQFAKFENYTPQGL